MRRGISRRTDRPSNTRGASIVQTCDGCAVCHSLRPAGANHRKQTEKNRTLVQMMERGSTKLRHECGMGNCEKDVSTMCGTTELIRKPTYRRRDPWGGTSSTSASRSRLAAWCVRHAGDSAGPGADYSVQSSFSTAGLLFACRSVGRRHSTDWRPQPVERLEHVRLWSGRARKAGHKPVASALLHLRSIIFCLTGSTAALRSAH